MKSRPRIPPTTPASPEDAVLRAAELTLAYGGEPVVQGLDLDILAGRITVLVGSNGCGKSTLLKALGRLLKPEAGTVILNGTDIHRKSTTQVARELAVLPQTPVAPEGLTVEQLVRLGRYPHQSWLRQWSAADAQIVEDILRTTELLHLRSRSVDTLSGGQRQRAWIAMTLAQDTDLLLLDEPTTYLDLAHQIEVLDVLEQLNLEHGKTVVMVLHDLNLAARYAHHMIAMHGKTVHAQGTPAEVLDAGTIQTVFGLACTVIADPVYGTPLCVPLGRRRPGATPG